MDLTSQGGGSFRVPINKRRVTKREDFAIGLTNEVRDCEFRYWNVLKCNHMPESLRTHAACTRTAVLVLPRTGLWPELKPHSEWRTV